MSDEPRRMRLIDNIGVCGPVVGEGDDYITIEYDTVVEVTRKRIAFEPAPPAVPSLLDLTHEVVLNFLDEIVDGRFVGREALLRGQAKLIASGLRENFKENA